MGRCKDRIPIVLEHIDWYDFILKLGYVDAYFKDHNCPDHLITEISALPRDKTLDIAEICKENINSIESFWNQNPDLRLTQVLTFHLILQPCQP